MTIRLRVAATRGGRVLERIRFESEMRDLILWPSPSSPRLAADLSWLDEREDGKGSTKAPTLVGQERQPPATTLYVRIPLGTEGSAKPLTAIYLPAAVKPAKSITVILYLHGHKGLIPGAKTSIREYLKHKYFPLREVLDATGRRFVLVAPTLGPKSEPGKLRKRGGLDWYLGQVSSALEAHASYDAAPAIERLILAAHSGGGAHMRGLALSSNAAAAAIAECWGFDCFYAGDLRDAKEWAKWAKAHPHSRLYIHYLHGTAERSKALEKKGLPNVFVARSGATDPDRRPHYMVPVFHWKDRILAVPP